MSAGDQPDTNLTAAAEIVRMLSEVMRENGLTKLDLQVGETSIRLRAGGAREVIVAQAQVAIDPPETVEEEPEPARGHIITAPMIGTFYFSAGPGESPFVKVGDEIAAGQTIGIIEAMKIMNEIAADCAGTVMEIIAANSQAVEYGSPLLRVQLTED